MKKKTTKEAEKPSINALLAAAGRGYAKTVSGLTAFCATYAQALDLYGSVGKNEFHKKYALYTASDWETFEDIGRGRLLPQFAFCSNNMKRGLLRLENSLSKQMILCGFDAKGKVEVVNAAGKVVKKSLEDLTKLEEDSLLFALAEGADPKELQKFAREYRMEFARNLAAKPNIELVGDYLVVRRKVKLSKEELQQWLSRMP